MDLTVFSESSSSSLDSVEGQGKQRKMTYDFHMMIERAANGLEKDILFKKMNEEEILW